MTLETQTGTAWAEVEKQLKIAKLIRGLDAEGVDKLVESLGEEEHLAVLDDWSLWALPYQRLPEGEWRRWLLRAGRGAGKTTAAARAVNELARDRTKIRSGEIGIIARTHTDARFTCVEGPGGILANASSTFRPLWYPGHGLLVWPNGVRGRIFSADRPEGLRGPNWSVVWADEICTWPDVKRIWWEVVELALRIGWARAIITTTPTPDPFLQELEKKKDTITTRASTFDNRFLAEAIKENYRAVYEGTRIGLQELLGEYLEDNIYALWRYDLIEETRVTSVPPLHRVVVSIDPAVTATERSDETGIIVYGIDPRNHGYVLDDSSSIYQPHEWGLKAVSLYQKYKADRVIAEVNQGGDMVEATLRAVDPTIPYASVRATRGKLLRAEPVAALYEREMVHHVGVYRKLEDQMITWVPGKPSPDRLDALVHAATYLQLPKEKPAGPIRAYF